MFFSFSDTDIKLSATDSVTSDSLVKPFEVSTNTNPFTYILIEHLGSFLINNLYPSINPNISLFLTTALILLHSLLLIYYILIFPYRYYIKIISKFVGILELVLEYKKL